MGRDACASWVDATACVGLKRGKESHAQTTHAFGRNAPGWCRAAGGVRCCGPHHQRCSPGQADRRRKSRRHVQAQPERRHRLCRSALWYYVPSWTIAYSTCSMLLNYPHAPAPRGSRLVPEVAQGFPTISRNGLIYTFKLKRTYRLSDGKALNAQQLRVRDQPCTAEADGLAGSAVHRGHRRRLGRHRRSRVDGPRASRLRMRTRFGFG